MKGFTFHHVKAMVRVFYYSVPGIFFGGGTALLMMLGVHTLHCFTQSEENDVCKARSISSLSCFITSMTTSSAAGGRAQQIAELFNDFFNT